MDLSHVAEMGVTALCGSIPVVLYIWSNKRQAKADVERRHQENKAILDGLVTERKYFPAHAHGEKSGSLYAEGVKYPPNGK